MPMLRLPVRALHHRIGDLENLMIWQVGTTMLHHRIGDLESTWVLPKREYKLHHRIGDLEINAFG